MIELTSGKLIRIRVKPLTLQLAIFCKISNENTKNLVLTSQTAAHVNQVINHWMFDDILYDEVW